MKKSKKFLSVLCTVCMILAMSAPAFAATNENTDTSDISVFAGGEKAIHLVNLHTDGTQTSYDFSVSIPKNADVAEESALTMAAVHNAVNQPAARMPADPIFTKSDVTIDTANPSKPDGNFIGTINLKQSYSTLYVEFVNFAPSCSHLNIRVYNDKIGGNIYKGTDDISKAKTLITMIDGNPYGDGELSLSANSNISIYASTGTTQTPDNKIVVDTVNVYLD